MQWLNVFFDIGKATNGVKKTVVIGVVVDLRNLADQNLADADLIAAMVANPALIERPIVVANGKAALGRPPEAVLEIL